MKLDEMTKKDYINHLYTMANKCYVASSVIDAMLLHANITTVSENVAVILFRNGILDRPIAEYLNNLRDCGKYDFKN